MVLDRRHLADLLGISTTTLDRYVEQGLPYLQRPSDRTSKWQFDAKVAIRWWLDHQRQKRTAPMTSDEQASVDLARARLDLARHEFEERRGQFITCGSAADVHDAIVRVLRRTMEPLANRIGEKCAGLEGDRMFRAVRDEVYHQLDVTREDHAAWEEEMSKCG